MTFSARRICGSSSQTRMRRRHAVAGTDRERERDDERGALAGQRLDVHPAAVGLDEALDDRQPEAGAGASAVERLEDALLLGERDARPLVDDADEQAAAGDPRAHRHGPAAGVAQRVLQQVRERALELRGVGLDQRQIRIERELRAGALGVRRGSPPRASTSRAAASAVPACSRERSSSFSISRVSRAPSPAIAAASSRRSSSGERGRAERLARGHHRRQRRAQVVRDRRAGSRS